MHFITEDDDNDDDDDVDGNDYDYDDDDDNDVGENEHAWKRKIRHVRSVSFSVCLYLSFPFFLAI